MRSYMKDEEKNLIENLFHRLKKTELSSSERDDSADNLIQELVKKQPASSYYMAQTILIQETAIKKMSIQIEELKKRIEILKLEKAKKKPSFLSNFFKNNPSPQPTPNEDHIWKNKESPVQSYNSNSASSPAITPIALPTRSSGFLSNALQTATGVAGGMILGNMLMNVFNHSKPEEEIFNTIDKSTTDFHKEDSSFDHSTNLVDHEQYEAPEVDKNIYQYESDSDNTGHIEDYHDIEHHVDDIDTNDDNFI